MAFLPDCEIRSEIRHETEQFEVREEGGKKLI